MIHYLVDWELIQKKSNQEHNAKKYIVIQQKLYNREMTICL